jgi:hypothetical protein
MEVKMAETPKRLLASKMVDIMKAVGYIRKSGTNQAQGYKYVMATDVADTVRDEMAKLNVSLVPSQIDVISQELTPSGKQTLLTLRFTWTLTDGDSGEFICWQSIGTGSDSGDKAAYKAATGALKYALLTGFLIPTGDDPENDTVPAGVSASDKKVFDKAKELFTADAKPAASTQGSDDLSSVEF